MSVSAVEIMRKPYAMLVIPVEEGGYFAEILEFPGCIAQGETAQEAITELEGAAIAWIEAAISQGQEIPPPDEIFGPFFYNRAIKKGLD